MVEVLSSADIKLHIPSEVDVYTDPHTRMKQLIATAAESIQLELINMDTKEREQTLHTVYAIMWELKTHEIIENVYIMNKLKERLAALEIYNQLVCNCHEDSTVLYILDLLENIHGSRDLISVSMYWQKLQFAIHDFMDEFVPHMEEEEKTFLPLLFKYFDYDELKEIKKTVILQHQLWKLRVEQEQNIYDLKENLKEEEFRPTRQSSSYCEKLNQFEEESGEPSTVEDLPDEILVQIFGYLSPSQLLNVGRVSKRWHGISIHPSFWRVLALNAWQHGVDTWEALHPIDSMTGPCDDDMMEVDTENLFFEKFSRFLPKISSSVRKVHLAGSKLIDNYFVDDILKNCAGIVHLDVSYTSTTDCGLKNISHLSLKHVDLSACSGVSDNTIAKLSSSNGELCYLNLSGCHELTDRSLLLLDKVTASLKFIDFSGCYRFSGSVLKDFISRCTNLEPENLYYCDLIRDGPYPLDCNGCNNTESGIRVCCLKYS